MNGAEPSAAARPAPTRVAIVTGPAGAGRITAIRAFEDLGFETIDNLPLSLLDRVLEPETATGGPPAAARRIAIGLDSRTRGFSAAALAEAVAGLSRATGISSTLLFLDCGEEALLERFSETRRRHPLAAAASVADGVAADREAMAPLREIADMVIDTTRLTPHQLRAAIDARFGAEDAPGLSITVQSFSYKRSPPRDADMTLDVRFLSNPHWRAELRPLDGRDPRVAEFVADDPIFDPFFQRMLDLMLLLLPAYEREGKSYFSVAVGCTGGRHRSVMVAERLARRLAAAGWSASVRHRELEAPGPGPLADAAGGRP